MNPRAISLDTIKQSEEVTGCMTTDDQVLKAKEILYYHTKKDSYTY